LFPVHDIPAAVTQALALAATVRPPTPVRADDPAGPTLSELTTRRE
jgi:hypothetical protein